MLSDSLRQRLEALNREQLPAGPPARRANRVVTAKASPQSAKQKLSPQQAFLVRGSTTRTPLGEHLTVRLPVVEIWPQAEELLLARYQHLASTSDQATSNEPSDFIRAFPDRFLALDLETCGLSGSALFLVGVARRLEEQFVVELLFARNYAEEAAVLHSLSERLTAVDALVTFNGKSFDWPMVKDRWHRYLLHRTAPLPELTHFDVLHHARRRWRKTLPDCKLQTIERMICRRCRTGDIAGHMIPGAYDHYVQTGSDAEMNQVLYHNAMDLVTLLDVAMLLAG